jgi:hypothetical protein
MKNALLGAFSGSDPAGGCIQLVSKIERVWRGFAEEEEWKAVMWRGSFRGVISERSLQKREFEEAWSGLYWRKCAIIELYTEILERGLKREVVWRFRASFEIICRVLDSVLRCYLLRW